MGKSLTIASANPAPSPSPTLTRVPAVECVVLTIARPTGAFRSGEYAVDVTTPTRFPSSSTGEPGSGQVDPAANTNPFKSWLTCPSASSRATVSWPR